MAVSKTTMMRGLLAAGLGIAFAASSIVPSIAEAPASQEQRIQQQSGSQLGVPEGGGGRGGAVRPAPQPQQAPPVARQPQQRQPNFSQDEGRGPGRRGGGYGGPGFGGGYGGGDFDDGPRYRRRPPVAYDEPVYGGGGGFGRACATSRGVCYVRRPQPFGSGCRCDIPGFGLKRGNIEG